MYIVTIICFSTESNIPIPTPEVTAIEANSSSSITPVTPVTNRTADSSSTTNTSRKRKRDEMEALDSELAKVDTQISNFKKDEAAIIGEGIAAKLRLFNPYQMALARRNIENVLFDIQYGSAAENYPSQYTQL